MRFFEIVSAFVTECGYRFELKCPACDSSNRPDAKFCEECGAKIEMFCPGCGATIPPGKNFCGECGHELKKPAETPPIDYSEPQSYTPKFLADKILWKTLVQSVIMLGLGGGGITLSLKRREDKA